VVRPKAKRVFYFMSVQKIYLNKELENELTAWLNQKNQTVVSIDDPTGQTRFVFESKEDLQDFINYLNMLSDEWI